MRKRPYARRRAATTSRSDRLKATMARMDEKMKAAKAEKAKKAAAKKAANAKTKAKNQATRTAAAASKTPSKGAGSRSRVQAASKITGRTMTRAGEFKTFAKDSSAAKNFRSAFAAARKAGKKTFTWNGKRYTTAMK